MAAKIVNLAVGGAPILNASTREKGSSLSQLTTKHDSINHHWTRLQHQVKCNGRFLCLFSDNKRQEQARKALESALSEKKNELEKWNKEIKRREELGGGGGGGGGLFGGWGRWFGWSNDDNFWREATHATLTILAIVLIYLLIAKGDLLLAVVFNPLLYALRSVRKGFAFVTSKFSKSTSVGNQPDFDGFLKKEVQQHASAKENVVRKWGSD